MNRTPELLLERRGPAAWITVNRPEARNSFTHAMYARMAELCEELARDDGVRVVVMQGRGDDAFVAGSDISGFADFRTGDQARSYEAHVERGLLAYETLPKPTLALLKGSVTGSGAAFATVSDLRIAAPNLKLGVPIARTLGNTLSLRNIARMVDTLGPAMTKDLLLTGRLVEAEEAARRGIVHEVQPLQRIEARVQELAEQIASLAPVTLRALKLAILRVLEARRMAMGDGADLVELAYTSEDFREGVRAFLEKRAPKWRGR
jgi:enoyl-CoA hydratase/carnithine racemase